jgi:hypothetical protein
VDAYGVKVGVRVSDRALLPALLDRLPPGARSLDAPEVGFVYSVVLGGEGPRPGQRRYHVVYSDAHRLARTFALEEALDAFESDLQLYVAATAETRLFVHAGVVGWRGRAILFPGKSLSGKSTLVAEMLRAGATYYSDEFALLDDEGRVYPYPKALSMRETPGSTRQTRRAPSDFGGGAGEGPLPVGAVVVCQYREGARLSLRALSPGQGGLALLANTVPARTQPARALSVLSRVAAKAPVYKGTRGEAAAAVAPLLTYLGD